MISVLYNIILITNFKLIEMCIKSSPFGEGRGGVLGLLKPVDPETVDAADVVHADVTTAEEQAVRAAAVPWVSTWRPIVAPVANVVQITSAVVTQGGQVEVIACISSGGKARIDTAAVVGVALPCCT